MVPLETGQVTTLELKPLGKLPNVTNVSEGLKPLPDTTTVTPREPEGALSEIVAVFATVNDVETKSETGPPVAVTL
jgi:hypothetical protein